MSRCGCAEGVFVQCNGYRPNATAVMAMVYASSCSSWYYECDGARKTLEVCVFNITDDRISYLLISLAAKGVKVRVRCSIACTGPN